ncbi:hypothetical protein Q1695_015298 [Nippostrongylus brasiliensis]|nr:hypothetical protein Q1695_015298 [Nippostrongylus brasiliensis]
MGAQKAADRQRRSPDIRIYAMFMDTMPPFYYNDPCSSTSLIVPDTTTMCDTKFPVDIGFPHAATDGYDFHQADAEMDSLITTLSENPDYFDPTAFCAPPPGMSLHGSYADDYTVNVNPPVFSTEYYGTSPSSPTPVASPNPPSDTSGAGRFEEFSLATQLPVLNGYAAPYCVSEPTSAKYQSFDSYPPQYFFTTPPDTPPNLYPAAPMSAPSAPFTRQTTCSSTTDPTPTIRKLLQQKKKRISAVPCHLNSVCTTCQTRTTSLWRRNHLGEIECNACNLYFRKNNCKRPVTLRKDEIMKRKRKPRVETASTNGSVPAITTAVETKPHLFV